jgi:hypothetical protein
MIYLGDGITDIPCMRIVRNGGGNSIAVYEDNPELGLRMKEQGRVNYVLPADFRKGKSLEKKVFEILNEISSDSHRM